MCLIFCVRVSVCASPSFGFSFARFDSEAFVSNSNGALTDVVVLKLSFGGLVDSRLLI